MRKESYFHDYDMNSFDEVQSWTADISDDTPGYCEENVWKLCEKLKNAGSPLLDCSYAVFISNDERAVPLWRQRSGKTDNGRMVVWDYHVILVVKKIGVKSLVVDFDNYNRFVTLFANYVSRSLRSEDGIHAKYRRKFRVVPAAEYLEKFASDRTHMLRPDGSYSSPPPPYPPIKSEKSYNNIQDFISMDPARGYGAVYDLESFSEFFK